MAPDKIEDIRVEAIWPNSSRSISAEDLRRLSDESFRQLCRLIKARARLRGMTRNGAQNLARKLHRRRWPYSMRKIKRLWRSRDCQDDPWMNSLYPDRKKDWQSAQTRMRLRNQPVINLNNFSFLDDPVGTIVQLRRLVEAEATGLGGRVNLLDEQVLDMAPYMVWGLMAKNMFPFSTGGVIHSPVQTVIEAAELKDFMNITRFHDKFDADDVLAFPLRRRRGAGQSTSVNIATNITAEEKVSDALVVQIDKWLSMIDRELTPDAKYYIATLVGEIVDNAERHGRSGGDGDWAVAGFMQRRTFADENGEEQVLGFCNLVFINEGLSIMETISTAEEDRVRNGLTNYIHAHDGKSGQTAETLACVFALQDGISRVAQSNNTRGGVGLMDAVQMTNTLGTLNADSRHIEPRLAILSGGACVIFKDQYRDAKPLAGRRFQWFNDVNSPSVPPSINCVFPLPCRVAGTIISARFAIAPDRSKATET